MEQCILEIRNLSKSFKELKVLDNISLKIYKKDVSKIDTSFYFKWRS